MSHFHPHIVQSIVLVNQSAKLCGIFFCVSTVDVIPNRPLLDRFVVISRSEVEFVVNYAMLPFAI